MSSMLAVISLWSIATILWWSGWREEIGGGISHRAVGIFLVGWPFTWLWQWRLNTELNIQGVWVWTFIAFVALFVCTLPARRWTALSVGILLGSIYLLLSRLSYYPLLLSPYLSSWGLALVVGALAALLLSYASEQLLAISASFFIVNAVAVGFHSPLEVITFGDTAWMEGWWMAVLFSRLWSVTIPVLLNQMSKWVFRWGRRRGGQR
jgi:hypothetical protein